jgi:hypothetical protein
MKTKNEKPTRALPFGFSNENNIQEDLFQKEINEFIATACVTPGSWSHLTCVGIQRV